MLMWREKKRSLMISIYGCNSFPPESTVDFFHYPLNVRWSLYGWLSGSGQETPAVSFGVLAAAGSGHSAFDFLGKLGHPRAPGHQVSPASVTYRGLHPLPSPRGRSSSGEKSPTFYTPTNSPHSSSISSSTNKADMGGGRLCLYCSVSVLRCATSEDVSLQWRSLPSHQRLWNHFQPKSFLPPSLTRPSRTSEGWAEPCSEHSLIASAEAERRQQLDSLLLIPWESGEKSAESKPPIPGLVLKAAWSLASHANKIKPDLACSEPCCLTRAQQGLLQRAQCQGMYPDHYCNLTNICS